MKRLDEKRINILGGGIVYSSQYGGKAEVKKLRPLYCRTGSKYLMADEIIHNFIKHKIYVEPFFGGGGVFWSKKKSDIEIVNDLDTPLINSYKLIKKASADPSKYRQNLKTKYELEEFLNKKKTNNEDKLTEDVIRRCNGFLSQYIGKSNIVAKPSNPFTKLKNIKEYKNRIKDTIIKNEDYKKIIHDYDSIDTLFYLDPPYENSKGLYKNFYIDYKEMRDILKNIKGKFLLSINGSPYIRKVFKDFKIKQIELKTRAQDRFIKPRVELLIKNY